MTAIICLLRGVNVGGRGKLAMSELREICLSLKLRNPATYIQSGNVVFAAAEPDLAKLTGRIESAIEKRCGFTGSAVDPAAATTLGRLRTWRSR